MSEELVEYVKPDGSKIKLNQAPATVKKAADLGWKKAGDKTSAVNAKG